jgi:DNA-binding YbaB/EbfC family protein
MMKNQLAGLMQQAQKMQENVKRVQEELEALEVEGQAGAGGVRITLTCKFKVRRVQIDPALAAEDREMLEDLVATAFNDAVRRAEQTAQERMGAVTAGLPLPPGFKMPFL